MILMKDIFEKKCFSVCFFILFIYFVNQEDSAKTTFGKLIKKC